MKEVLLLPIDWDGNGTFDARDVVTGLGIDAASDRGSNRLNDPDTPHARNRGGCAGAFYLAAGVALLFVITLAL